MGDILRENPPVDTALVNKIIGAPVISIDKYWAQADEDKVLARWDGCERKAASDAIGEKAAKYFGPLRELWKVCLRIFKLSPPIMLSPINGLQFVPRRLLAGSHSHHLFSPEACRSMAALTVHPIWKQDYQCFIDAVYYAVICRLDAFRKFTPKDDECPVLRMLNRQIDLEDGPMLREPLHQMHSNARKAVKRQRNGDKPSALSNLLYTLGKSIETVDSTKITKSEAESLQQDILPFNLQGLKSLKNAIDTMKKAQHKVDDTYKAYRELVDLSEELPSRDHLSQWDARAAKHLFRRFENEARFGSSTPGPDFESDHAEEQSEREAMDSNPAAGSGHVAIESPQVRGQHLNDEHTEPELSDENTSPSIGVPTGNFGTSNVSRWRSPPHFPYGDFRPRPSSNHHTTLGDGDVLRSALDKRDHVRIRQDVDNLMAQAPSMGQAEIRQLVRDENARLQSRIQDYAEENRGLQARLKAYEEDSQRLQQLDQEKRERQKVRETQDRRYRLLEAEVQSLKEKLDGQASMSLPVVL
jgi:hypothetical protein